MKRTQRYTCVGEWNGIGNHYTISEGDCETLRNMKYGCSDRIELTVQTPKGNFCGEMEEAWSNGVGTYTAGLAQTSPAPQ